MAKRRVGRYPEAFRRMALERMKNCTSVTALAEEFEQQARQGSEAASLSAPLAFFQPSTVELTTRLLGEGTQTPSLPQTPTLLGESTR